MAGRDLIAESCGGRQTEAELEIFQPVTRKAIAMVEGWTESEAINGWFYMAGANPEAVAELDEHITRMRELAFMPRAEAAQ
jgi:hypothetical protein